MTVDRSVQHKPWSVQVELVEGCNRYCLFCGIRGIKKGPLDDLRFMDEAVGRTLARHLGQSFPGSRYEFAMHGEPTLHPKYFQMIAHFRQWLPKTQFQTTTNGMAWRGRLAKMTREAFAAGIDLIILDTYGAARADLRAEALALESVGIQVLDYFTDCLGRGWSPYANWHRKQTRIVVLMDDLLAQDGRTATRKVANHVGNSGFRPALLTPLAKGCTVPFREMSINYDGRVNLCCDDFSGEFVCGDLRVQSPAAVWYGPTFNAARKCLGMKRRWFTPCWRCDVGGGTRAGLLPRYAAPTEADVDIIEAVVSAHTGRNKHLAPRADRARLLGIE